MSERTRYTFRGHHHNFLLLLVAMDSLLLLFLAVAVTVAGDPTPSPNPARVGPEGHGNVDPHQLTALHSLGYPTSNLLDPCTANSTTVSATCDSAAPFRHVTTLHLANCSTDIAVSGAALAALSPTLRSLSFSSCPAAAPRHLPPPPLAASLRSFSAVSSLRHLSALWLSHLSGLYSLSITGTPIVSSASNDCLAVVVSQMRNLTTLTLSNANLSGLLPRHWHCADHLARLDLSMNRFTGRIPSSITLLGSLQHLNLSSNSLAGSIPASIGDMIALQNASFANNSLSGEIPISVSRLTELVHLDLGSNRFNGSLPGFLSKIRGLRVLNLENNDFHGVIPFNATFLARLESFRVAGNSKLCYNRTVLSSKLKLGIAPCDKYGYPMSPPPERTARSDKSTDYSEDGDGSGGGGGHRGPNPLVLGVAIGLSCLVFLVILLVCLSKVCG